jgi:hypothetical protein
MKIIGDIIGRVLGSPVAMDKAVGGFAKGLDALVYTKEEKADDARKDTAEFRGVMVEWFKNSQGQNLSRRILALTITFAWIGMFFLSCGTAIAAIFVDNAGDVTQEKLQWVAGFIGDNAERLNGGVMLIIGFYFAAPHLGAIIKPAMEKFSGKARNVNPK